MSSIFQKIKDWLNPTDSLKTLSSPAGSTPVSAPLPLLADDEPEPIVDPLRRKVKLIMVTEENNNKFYEMEENQDETFTVTYGRVGTKSTRATYPLPQWDAKYREKVRKGYTDQTHLFADVDTATDTSTIKDATVQTLVEQLIQYATSSIRHNYVVSANQVSRKQVEEAQRLLDSLANSIPSGDDHKAFNENLLALYRIIPRKMIKVNQHLVKADDDTRLILDKLNEEQETLDVMRTQVEIIEQQKEQQPHEPLGFLESIGLQVTPVEEARVIKLIRLMMGDSADKYQSAYAVANLQSKKRFESHLAKVSNKKTQLFWHGSRNENWLSILKSGLVLRPANAVITGKMFGHGLYFANEFKKSINYTSINGSYWAGGTANDAYLAIYEVHTGSQFEISQHDDWCYDLDLDNLGSRGKYDSVYAKRGVSLLNNEFIVYQEPQCTIKYLVKIN